MPCAFTVSVYRATSSLLSVTSHFLVCAVWLAPETEDAIHVSTLHPYKGVKGCLFYTLWSGLGLTSTKGNHAQAGKRNSFYLSILDYLSPLNSSYAKVVQLGLQNQTFSTWGTWTWSTLSQEPNGPSHHLDMKWLGRGGEKFGKALCSKGTGMIYLQAL